MKHVILLIVAVILLVGVAGCYTAPIKPPAGLIFTDIKAPLDPDLDKTALGKTGSAESTSILGMVATGDCSIEAAAKAGGLTTINHADYEYYNVLGVYQKFTVKVYGN